MTIIVIGDVAEEQVYHLGDEAMTEYALDALRVRGATSLTVVAASPRVAVDRFGTAAIPRIGFRAISERARMERLEGISKYLKCGKSIFEPEDSVFQVIDAFRDAKALVIAGGGNISSSFANHIYERLALARIAKHFGVPVLITSQTFGPLFKAQDELLLKELLSLATVIGARESYSHGLAQACAPFSNVVHCVDDAAWLEPEEKDNDYIDSLRLPSRFAIASFTYHKGSARYTKREYFDRLAKTVDQLANDLDLDILLVPHVGFLDPSKSGFDQESNQEILQYSKSGRVVAMPMLTARQVISLTRKASLSLSTRYHPTVFGPSNEVPSIAITASYYSSVRMYGSLSNFGLGPLAIPSEIWTPELILDVAREVSYQGQAHLKNVVEPLRQQSKNWWDSIADTAINGSPWSPVSSIISPKPCNFEGYCSNFMSPIRKVSDDHLRAQVLDKWKYDEIERNKKRLEKRVKLLKVKVENLESQTEILRNDLSFMSRSFRERVLSKAVDFRRRFFAKRIS